MVKLHKFVILTLLFALCTTSLQGQNDFDPEADTGSAYTQGSQTAHWSVYVPIAIIVGAAIWFGVAQIIVTTLQVIAILRMLWEA